MIELPDFNIKQLFIQAFGLNAYDKISLEQKESFEPKFEKIEINQVRTNLETVQSPIGTPMWKPIKFLSGNYKRSSLTGEINDPFGYPSFVFPAATLTEFSRSKNIIRTPVLGGSGTVKELYSLDDWQIRIRTLCINTPGRNALEWKKQFLDWERVIDGIEVEGDLFSEKDIRYIVITDFNVNEIEGNPWVVPIEITAESTTPFELDGN